MSSPLALHSLLALCLVWSPGGETSVAPPPWSDPSKNPCALEENGWQLLYWPQDRKCYKIFQKGPPCPETMELVPGLDGARCECPPGWGTYTNDQVCYPFYERGPCNVNEYFGPFSQRSRERKGTCFLPQQCPSGTVLWAQEGQCYEPLKRGPCPLGKLIHADGLYARCGCDKVKMRDNYWKSGDACYELYSKGPCERGQIFLPGEGCGCNKSLAQYYAKDKLCYPFGSNGPCNAGFVYEKQQTGHGECECKKNHILSLLDRKCYFPFTRGPCPYGRVFNQTTGEKAIQLCFPVPCMSGSLYFPEVNSCHKIGTRGPCLDGQIVMYHEGYDTSNGISWLGRCGCQQGEPDNGSFLPTQRAAPLLSNGTCPTFRKFRSEGDAEKELCHVKGLVNINGTCYELYKTGPCKQGQWVVPANHRTPRNRKQHKIGKCECRPGFKTSQTADGENECLPPIATIVDFLNKNFTISESQTKTLPSL